MTQLFYTVLIWLVLEIIKDNRPSFNRKYWQKYGRQITAFFCFLAGIVIFYIALKRAKTIPARFTVSLLCGLFFAACAYTMNSGKAINIKKAMKLGNTDIVLSGNN